MLQQHLLEGPEAPPTPPCGPWSLWANCYLCLLAFPSVCASALKPAAENIFASCGSVPSHFCSSLNSVQTSIVLHVLHHLILSSRDPWGSEWCFGVIPPSGSFPTTLPAQRETWLQRRSRAQGRFTPLRRAMKKSGQRSGQTVFWKAAPGTCQGAVSSPSLDLTPVSSPRGVLGELERGMGPEGLGQDPAWHGGPVCPQCASLGSRVGCHRPPRAHAHCAPLPPGLHGGE